MKRGSLLLNDLEASQRDGLRGPQGAQGPKGEVGPSGATHVTTRESALVIAEADAWGYASVDCQPGEVATGGGFLMTNGNARDMAVSDSRPKSSGTSPTGWDVQVFNLDHNNDNANTISVRAYAICASP